MTTKNIQDVVNELVTKIDDIQKKYWNEHTVTPQDEDITKELTTTLTQLVKEVGAGEREKLRVHIEREVVDPILDETKTFGPAKIINTLRDTLKPTTPPTSDVIEK